MVKGIEVEINKKRAKAVFRILDDFWRNQKGVFSNVVLPQDAWPTPDVWQTGFKNDRDKANWLFYVALPMRGGVISEVPFKLWWDLKAKRPELFDPFSAVGFKPSELEKILTETIVETFKGGASKLKSARENGQPFGYKIPEHARSWIHNSRVLRERWSGDIRNVFGGIKDFEEAFAHIDYKQVGKENGFKGMRRKIFALLTIWLQEKRLIPVFPTPIPVDFHALRILWATDIIKDSKYIKELPSGNDRYPAFLKNRDCIRITEPFVDAVTKWSQKFLQKEGFSHLVINPALWVLGRRLCGRNFQNKTKKNASVYQGDAQMLSENPYLWPKNYKNSCDFCPLEHLCEWAIPSGPYYRLGLIVKASKRIKPPNQLLPFSFWKDIYPFNKK